MDLLYQKEFKMLPTSSIAMATYNGEKYLRRQLDSLAEQTVLPDELVVCDDGSTDKTMEILHQFAETAPFPVRIFQNEKNLGVCANFCKAFSLCEKEVTFFCDQDDVWFSQKLEKVLKVMETEPEVGLVLTYDQRVDEKEVPCWGSGRYPYRMRVLLKKKNDFQTILRYREDWSGHNMACRTRYRQVLGNHPSVPYDVWIFRVMGALAPVRVVPEVCCSFRRHGANVTTNPTRRKGLFSRVYHSWKRHQNREILWNNYHTWQIILHFLEENESHSFPEVLKRYHQIAEHLKTRLEIRDHPQKRFWLVFREFFLGHYHYSIKGLRHAFFDLFVYS